MAPCAAAQAMKPCAARPYIRSTARAPGRSTAGLTGTCEPARLLLLALMTTSNAVPQSCRLLARKSTPWRWASGWWRAARSWALVTLRFASTRPAGAASSKGPSTPAAAPPAPTSSTRRPASATSALRVMSRTRPTPSVLSAHQPWRVEAQHVGGLGQSAARGERLRASWKASNLNGTVTLQPRAPEAAKAVTVAAKAVQRAEQPLVVEAGAGLCGELGVNAGRAAVFDRVADDCVTIHAPDATGSPGPIPWCAGPRRA